MDVLDAWRTVAIVTMVLYHFLYDLAAFGRMTWEQFFSPGLNALQLFICGSFILLAGISSRLSRNNARRGLVTLGAGFLVMLGAYAAGLPIWFGILQFLGVTMLIYAALGKYFQRVPNLASAVLYPVLFFVTRAWTDAALVSTKWLWPLGFRYAGFSSADYFPILPWIFLFLFGAWLGGVLLRTERAAWLYRSLPVWLTWPGRHSLVIYVLHQPVLYGLCYVCFSISIFA